MKARWVIEALVLVALLVAFAFFRDAYSGYFSATAAIQQLNSSWDSLGPLVAYQYAYRGTGILFIGLLIGIGVFEVGSYTKEKEIQNEEA